MTIPLDRLYNHIDRLSQSHCGDCLIIYRFFPHGSKKLEDLTALKFTKDSKTWTEFMTSPAMICHDQEPLNYELYTEQQIEEFIRKTHPDLPPIQYFIDTISKMNLRATNYCAFNCYDLTMLTHSEKNSSELTKYENNGFVGVYWWSHAAIARDWYRYAEHITQSKQIEKIFLIYNRAWSGTREYRLKFANMLLRTGLEKDCKMSINPVEPELGIHYELHNFSNTQWRPTDVLENYFPISNAHSYYSADFDIEDYEATDIEVVLETLFDDSRIHLTEKSLRPIACGQPFILAGTPGSLEYLRSYGFKTFGHIWDERYDLEQDPQYRLNAIVDLMNQIANWSPLVRERKMAEAREISEYNKKLFFSSAWHDLIFDEFEQNFQSAWNTLKKNRTGKHYLQLKEYANQDPAWAKIVNADLPWRTQEDVKSVIQWINNTSN